MSTDDASGGRMYEEFRRKYEAEQVLFLRDILQLVKSRLWVIALVVSTCVGIAAGYSLIQTPMYQTSSMVLIAEESTDQGNLNMQLQGLQSLMDTMVAAVQTTPIAEGVAERLGEPESYGAIQGSLSAEPVEKSQFVKVSYSDPDPERAQLVANTAGEVLSEQAPEIAPSSGASNITAKVWEEARLPSAPVSPDLKRNLFIALMLSLILGFGLAFLLAYLDDTWKAPEEVEEVSGIPNLASIPTFRSYNNHNIRRFSSRRQVYHTVTQYHKNRRNGGRGNTRGNTPQS
jgi:capsular polysaccharide biosynthesis protein